MAKLTKEDRGKLSTMKATLKSLQTQLATAKKVEGIDEYLGVRLLGTRFQFSRTKVEAGPDRAVGEFRIGIELTAKRQTLYVPLSVTSGKTTAGFMYLIEGTGEASVASGDVGIVTRNQAQVSHGSIRYAAIAAGKKAEFELVLTVRGQVGRQYQIVINRLNYKLAVGDARYQQYLKPLAAKRVKFA